MEALKKLQHARKTIRLLPLKKQGRNTYSEYDYFTPAQISGMVAGVNEELNLFHKFDLIRSELGLVARLTIFDLDSDKDVQFTIATEIPSIKATNVAQQLGGAVTYSERYLLQIAYDIKDNNLDFDTTGQTKKANAKPKKVTKPILTPDCAKWPAAIDYLRKDGKIKGITDAYEITEENIQTLILASEL